MRSYTWINTWWPSFSNLVMLVELSHPTWRLEIGWKCAWTHWSVDNKSKIEKEENFLYGAKALFSYFISWISSKTYFLDRVDAIKSKDHMKQWSKEIFGSCRFGQKYEYTVYWEASILCTPIGMPLGLVTGMIAHTTPFPVPNEVRTPPQLSCDR